MDRNKLSLTINITILFILLGILITSIVFLVVPGMSNVIAYSLLGLTIILLALALTGVYIFRQRYVLKSAKSLNDSDFESTFVNERGEKSGFISYDNEGKILFISEWLARESFKDLMGKNISTFKFEGDVLIKQILNKTFKLVNNKVTKIINVENITVSEEYKEYIKHDKVSIMIVTVLYSNLVKENTEEYLDAKTQIEKILDKWTSDNNGLLSFVRTNDEYVITVRWSTIENWFIRKDDNSFFELFKHGLKNNYDETIISVGIASLKDSIENIFKESRKQLLMSQNKGGEVICINNEGKESVIGLSKLGFTEKNTSSIKFFKEQLIESVKLAKNIIITTHPYADVDALSSVLLLLVFLKDYNPNINYYIDTIDGTVDEVSDLNEYSSFNLKNDEVDNEIHKNSLVLFVDTSSSDNTQLNEDRLKQLSKSQVMIIDHHRLRGGHVLKSNQNLTYLNVQASSSAEIILQIISLGDQKLEKKTFVSSNLSTLLYAGISIDTNQLTKNISSETFSNLAKLLTWGADSTIVKKIIALTSPTINSAKTFYENAIIYKKNFVISSLPDNKIYAQGEIAELANRLLNYEGIYASFVIGKIEGNVWKVSARSSRKDINVQIIMEELGGGGHFESSAAIFNESIPISKIINMLKKEIGKLDK